MQSPGVAHETSLNLAEATDNPAGGSSAPQLPPTAEAASGSTA
jgi:hypothetical protein